MVTGGEPDVDYTYTPIGAGTAKNLRLTSVEYPNSRVVHYNYGATNGIDDRLNRLDNIAANGSPTNAQKYAAYTYLGAGTVVKVTHPGVTTGGLELTYLKTSGSDPYAAFDRFGRIVDQKWQNTAATVTHDRYKYGYDAADNRTYRENSKTHGTATKLDEYYTYDGLDRLTGYSRGNLTGGPPYTGVDTSTDVRIEAWGLTQTGNWKDYQIDANANGSFTEAGDLNQDRKHNKANEITDATYGSAITEGGGQASWIDPKHDLAGNMTLTPRPGDEATATEALVMIYDAWNRPVKVYKDNGTTSGQYDANDTLIATYSYDGKHRRIKKTTGGVAYDYYYNLGWQILEIRKDSDTDPYEQYVWGIRYVHSPVCRFEDHNLDESVETLYYCNDANFNVTALIETDGDVAERYVYDPYGKVTIYDDDWSDTVDWADSKKNVVLYTGHKFDNETGLFWACRRYYHPTLGRWVSRDPKDADKVSGGYHDGMNLHEYVGTKPVSLTDKLGLCKVKPGRKLLKGRTLKSLDATVAGSLYSEIARLELAASTQVAAPGTGGERHFFLARW